MIQTKSSLSFRKSVQEDVSRISEFRKNYFRYNSSLRCYEPEYYAWKCFSNPCQKGEMWLSEMNGEIVGLCTLTPKKMKVMDAFVDGAEAGDSFTRPDFRRLGISTQLNMSARESTLSRGITLLYNVPGRLSWLRDSTKLGHAEVPIKLYQLFKPLNISWMLNNNHVISRRLKITLYSTAFQWPLTAVVCFLKSRFCHHIPGFSSGIFVQKVEQFPDDIDIFGEQAARSFDVMLVCNRNYLNWRYLENPDKYSIYIAADNKQNTLGYLVSKICCHGKVKVGYIVDFLTLAKTPVLEKLVSVCLEEFRLGKVSYIHTWVIQNGQYGNIFSMLGFRVCTRLKLSVFQNEMGKQLTCKDIRWHFTMGCSDTI